MSYLLAQTFQCLKIRSEFISVYCGGRNKGNALPDFKSMVQIKVVRRPMVHTASGTIVTVDE